MEGAISIHFGSSVETHSCAQNFPVIKAERMVDRTGKPDWKVAIRT